MIPGFLKFPCVASASTATLSNAALFLDPEAFRSTALTWIAVISTVLFAALAAASQILPKVFLLLERWDEFQAHRREQGRHPEP